MKVHDKYKMEITLQTNEEMCKDLVIGLVDNAFEKIETQTESITEGLNEERCELKKAPDLNSHNSKESYSINIEALRKSIDKDEQEYKMKIELGREVYIYIEEAKIMQESLSKERQDALDLYIKQKERLDQGTTKLRPWQDDLLKYMKG